MSAVFINDINKDGLNDLIIHDFRSIRLGINDGNFQFTEKTLKSISDGFIVGFTIADVTGENERDMIICTSRKTIWLKNIDRVNFTFEQRDFNGANSIFMFHSTDFNKDGALDFAYANAGFRVLLNNIPQIPSSVSDNNQNIKIYPNPVSNILTIDGLDGTAYSVKVYSLAGMLVKEVKVQHGKADMSPIVPGQYILSIIDPKGNTLSNSMMIKQ